MNIYTTNNNRHFIIHNGLAYLLRQNMEDYYLVYDRTTADDIIHENLVEDMMADFLPPVFTVKEADYG